MPVSMHPHTLRRREGIQLSYNIPQRILTTCVYPRQSSNGSSVVVVGHESGLRVIWYGGRKFRSATGAGHLNGSTTDLTEVDETDHNLHQEYEEEQDEIDTSRPFQDVLTYHDIPFGAGASNLAFPSLVTERAISNPPILCETHIILAAACSDQTLRVVALPLQPQETLSDVQVIRLATASMHQDLISDIAITLTADGIGESDVETRARSRSRGRTAASEQEYDTSTSKWSLLVASASPTGNGLLLIHQLPLDNDSITTDPEDYTPAFRRFLRAPLLNCRLDFNPSPFPSERHSHLLVAIPDASSVQIYDILPQIGSVKRRRGSITAIDPVSSAGRTRTQSSSVGAKNLITLLPGFSSKYAENQLPQRKRVLDAKWIMQGRAVVALLEDGEWGIWDIEAVGPRSSNKSDNLVKGQTHVSGIKGGALTRFALSGNVGTNVVSTTRKSVSQSRPSSETTLAPMTPHIRKERSSDLFNTQDSHRSPSTLIEQSQGFVSVSKQHLMSESFPKVYDESLILTSNAESTFIPAVQAYWRSQDGAKGSLDKLGRVRPSVLPALYPTGESQLATHILPDIKGRLAVPSATPALISAIPSGLVLLVPSATDSSLNRSGSSTLPMRLTAANSDRQDQALLASGELDVDGMDRILDTMAHSSTENSTVLNAQNRKSNGSQFGRNSRSVEDDDDVDMDTPTHGKSSHSKLEVSRPGSETRRLFT